MLVHDRGDGEAGSALARPQGCARIHHSLTDRRTVSQIATKRGNFSPLRESLFSELPPCSMRARIQGPFNHSDYHSTVRSDRGVSLLCQVPTSLFFDISIQYLLFTDLNGALQLGTRHPLRSSLFSELLCSMRALIQGHSFRLRYFNGALGSRG